MKPKLVGTGLNLFETLDGKIIKGLKFSKCGTHLPLLKWSRVRKGVFYKESRQAKKMFFQQESESTRMGIVLERFYNIL